PQPAHSDSSRAMMYLLTALLVLAAVNGLLMLWVFWRRRRASKQFMQAVEGFSRHPDLSELFLAVANATGKPRGLRWKSCDLEGEPIFARDRASGEIFALAGATIGFEAIAGGDMEDVEAVGNIRYISAVFVFRDGRWQTDGRAIFNLEPAQAMERLRETNQFIER